MSSVLPADYSFSLHQGDTRVIEGTLRRRVSDDGVEPPVYEAVDLTGCELAAQVRLRPGAPLLASFECQIVGPPEEGAFRLILPAEESGKIFRDAWWDFQVRDPAGAVRTWLRGQITLQPDITRLEDEDV